MRLASTLAPVTAVGVVGVLVWLAGTQTISAADDLPAHRTRLAAVSRGPGPATHPWQTRSLRGGDAWLVAQGGEPDVSQAAWNENTVVAHFEMSAPEGAEKDIALAYDVELVEQSTLFSFNLRIARYRAPDPKSAASLMERLRKDYRVAEVQDGERYVRPVPSAPNTEVGLAAQPKQSATEAQPAGDAIVANFEMSAPDGAEEDVAKDHGLELVGKSKLFSLGMRIARYRVIDPQTVASLLERLRKDHRVAGVQETVRYARPAPEAPDIEVGLAAEPKQGAPQALRADSGPASRQPVATPRKAEPRQTSASSRLANASARQPPPGALVADVLSGGL